MGLVLRRILGIAVAAATLVFGVPAAFAVAPADQLLHKQSLGQHKQQAHHQQQQQGSGGQQQQGEGQQQQGSGGQQQQGSGGQQQQQGSGGQQQQGSGSQQQQGSGGQQQQGSGQQQQSSGGQQQQSSGGQQQQSSGGQQQQGSGAPVASKGKPAAGNSASPLSLAKRDSLLGPAAGGSDRKLVDRQAADPSAPPASSGGLGPLMNQALGDTGALVRQLDPRVLLDRLTKTVPLPDLFRNPVGDLLRPKTSPTGGPLAGGAGDLAANWMGGAGNAPWDGATPSDLSGLATGSGLPGSAPLEFATGNPPLSQGAASSRPTAPAPEQAPPNGIQAALGGSAVSLLLIFIALTTLLALAVAPLTRRLSLQSPLWRPAVFVWQLDRPG
jgi:hypothetical protein